MLTNTVMYTNEICFICVLLQCTDDVVSDNLVAVEHD